MTMTQDAGRGELNNAATWDDFPNGRFGDFKSPAFAFGNQDLWGGSGISVRASSGMAHGSTDICFREMKLWLYGGTLEPWPI